MTRSLLALLLFAPFATAQQQECKRGLEFPERIVSFNDESARYGDLNEDGRLDVVLFKSVLNETSILLDRGGVHEEVGSFRDGQYFFLWDVYDHNGDGHLDLLHATGATTRVRFGNGDATFRDPIDSQPGEFNKSWRYDFDGDGLKDIVSLAEQQRQAHFKQARRDGSFVSVATAALPRSLSHKAQAGDFDGDGHLDLFELLYVSSDQQFKCRFLWGAANHQFIAVDEPWTLPGPPHDLFEFGSADFDDNGSDEAYYVKDGVLVIIHADQRKLRVEQLSDPSLTHIDSQGSGLVTGLADLDADGMKDLVLGGRTVFFFKRKENGTFAPGEMIDMGSYAPEEFIDYNHDGIMDLVSRYGPNGVAVLLGGSGFPSARVYPAPFVPISPTITPADMNGDAIKDLVLTARNGATIFHGDRRGAFHAVWHTTFSESSNVVTDLDDDRIPDLISAESDGAIRVWFGTPDSFEGPGDTVATGRLFGVGRTKNRNAVVVFNNSTFYFMTTAGTQGTTMEELFELSGLPYPISTVVEADGDDESELLVYIPAKGTLLFNRTDTGWAAVATLTTQDTAGGASSADLNGDGKLDFALWEDSFSFLIAEAGGSYRRVTMLDEPGGWAGRVRSAALEDFDNDGLIDIFLATSEMYAVWRNVGGGQFERYVSSDVGSGVAGGTLLDTDGDGWKDVVAIAHNGVQVVRNVCAPQRLSVVASPRSTSEGGSVKLLVHARVTNLSSAVITIRDGSGVVHRHQPKVSDRSMTTWSTGPLALGTHVFYVELWDQYGPSVSTSIPVHVRPPASRRRGVRH